jgi:hypothetical protein
MTAPNRAINAASNVQDHGTPRQRDGIIGQRRIDAALGNATNNRLESIGALRGTQKGVRTIPTGKPGSFHCVGARNTRAEHSRDCASFTPAYRSGHADAAVPLPHIAP